LRKLATHPKAVLRHFLRDFARDGDPSEKAVQELISSAKEIGLDIAHGSWRKKARALKAGDLKLALARSVAKTTAAAKASGSSDPSDLPAPEIMP
jgi:hypothetical protein